MPITHADVQTHTDAELLALYRNALAAIATGQSYSIGGRQLTRADLKAVRETIEWIEARVAATDAGGGIALVQYGERV